MSRPVFFSRASSLREAALDVCTAKDDDFWAWIVFAAYYEGCLEKLQADRKPSVS